MLTCVDFPEAEPCCTSCHDDWDDLGYNMVELELPGETRTGWDAVWANVCCEVAPAAEKRLSTLVLEYSDDR